MVVRPYKTRDAFTNLSSPPTIYLNEYLIDDEEVVKYLILRDMIHIMLHMYLPMRYTGGLSYAEKFDSALNFFLPKEKVEEIREKMEKLIEVNRRLQYPLFSLFMGPSSAASCSATSLRRDVVGKEEEKETYPPASFPHRTFPTGIIILVRKFLQGFICRPPLAGLPGLSFLQRRLRGASR